MIESFRFALREVHNTQKKVIILMNFLKAWIFFLLLYAIVTLFNFYVWIVIVFTLIYFFWEVYQDITHISLRDVERRNPFLDEVLRTAADTTGIEDNPIVDALREQVTKGIKMVKISSFINTKKLTSYLFLICLLVSGNLVIGFLGLEIFDLRGFIWDSNFDIRSRLLGDDLSSSLLDAGIRVEDINQNNELSDISSQIKRRETLNIDELPEDIFKSGERGLDELFSKKKRIYIRNYFNRLR